jgi:hypothetical protein
MKIRKAFLVAVFSAAAIVLENPKSKDAWATAIAVIAAAMSKGPTATDAPKDPPKDDPDED